MANPFQYQASVFKKKNPELPLTFGVSTNRINKPQNKPAANGFSNYPGYNALSNRLAGSSKKDGSIGYIQYPSHNKTDTNQPEYEQPEEFDYNKTYSDYLQQMQDSQAQRYRQAQENAIQANRGGIDQILREYEQTKQNLQGQIPILEKQSKQTQDLIKRGLESVYKQGETSKSNIKDQSGETLRQQAQAKREVDAKRNAIFAGNNTVDSFGFGGYQLEQSNADSDFLREQNKTLRARDQQLAEIDSQITLAEAQAQAQIDNEISKFKDAVRIISQQLGDNEIAKQNAIENAYLKLQDTLFQINDSYNTNTARLYEKQLELMKAIQETQVSGTQIGEDKLSPEFILSGMTQPRTAEDYLYLQTKGAYIPKKLQSKNEIIHLVDSVLNAGVGNITGLDAFRGNIPGTAARDKKALVEQIKNKLSVEGREALRGSGQISDYEQKMLAKSVTALDYGMSEQGFINELKNIKRILSGGSADNPTSRYQIISVE